MLTSTRADGYLPLRSYAVLGDMRGAALVGADGAVDWLAVPVLDAPPICASLLDPAEGGSIELCPIVPFEVTRRYVDDTLVLETTFTTAEGTVRVTDALNRGAAGELPWAELARRVDVEAGEVPMRWSVRPGHGLCGIRPWCHQVDAQVRMLVGDRQASVVTEGVGPAVFGDHGIEGHFVARVGGPALLAVVATDAGPLYVPTPVEVLARIDATAETWRRWSGQITYDGAWRDIVVRSALTLKALTVAPSSAIAGAATTSLPEKVGGERNFDYRYAWIRDSSFAIDAMARLGLSEEVHSSLSWLLRAVAQMSPDLRVFYALDGDVASADMRAADAPGYRGSAPVHVGNAAAGQTQLGCFGDLIDAVWRYVGNGGCLDPADGAMIAALADRTCDLWRSPDAGLWELGDPQPYTISKIGCWVALDRALHLADAGQLTSLHQGRWHAERAAIRSWIDAHCWSATKRAYTFYAGTDDLDAAVLLAARTGYCAGDDPRLHTTIDAIASELRAGGADTPLLYRYSGQEGKEGTFTACACWMVEALTHAGRLDEATARLEALVGLANDVGLYSEEIDPAGDELLGNIPQTLSHLAVIGAATALSEARAKAHQPVA
ncbi:MAG: glycoside hydrolase family 15 protein [Acidimicrobiales bacterium]|nr:MAG: glycoside hydrolase family 15 protein [Acidimicrobiales bacterium]